MFLQRRKGRFPEEPGQCSSVRHQPEPPIDVRLSIRIAATLPEQITAVFVHDQLFQQKYRTLQFVPYRVDCFSVRFLALLIL
jgi:hypothetical protein